MCGVHLNPRRTHASPITLVVNFPSRTCTSRTGLGPIVGDTHLCRLTKSYCIAHFEMGLIWDLLQLLRWQRSLSSRHCCYAAWFMEAKFEHSRRINSGICHFPRIYSSNIIVSSCPFWVRSRPVLMRPRSSVRRACIGNECKLPADSAGRRNELIVKSLSGVLVEFLILHPWRPHAGARGGGGRGQN